MKKKQPCNRDRVKSRQSYCRIQLENIGSPFFPKYGVEHAKHTYREIGGITIYGWDINLSVIPTKKMHYILHSFLTLLNKTILQFLLFFQLDYLSNIGFVVSKFRFVLPILFVCFLQLA